MDLVTLQLAIIAAVSAFVQVVKERVALSPTALRWTAMVLGALSSAALALSRQGVSPRMAVAPAILGALALPGVHAALLQDTRLGQLLKALGGVVLAWLPKPKNGGA